MNEQQFVETVKKNGIELDNDQLKQFELYYELLIEWNNKVNLTAITKKSDVYLKHFYDSITPSFYFPFHDVVSLCDVGAGAGFPSIPLKICFPHLHITIVDSLKKRIHFLENVTATLQLTNVDLIHARAEDFGHQKKFRERFDVVTARAVARMSVLSEYCLPLSKVGGTFIALKGAHMEEELIESKKAISVLGGNLTNNETFHLPVENSVRSVVTIKKIKKTEKKYPRKAGTPAKSPIL